MMQSVEERIIELRKTWKSGFHIARVLFGEGYGSEEVCEALEKVGYRSHLKEYTPGTPYLFVSCLPDATSEMWHLIWWPRDDGAA